MEFNVDETGMLMYGGHILRMKIVEVTNDDVSFAYADDATEYPVELNEDNGNVIILDHYEAKMYFKKDMIYG